jgi:hypothetical protein
VIRYVNTIKGIPDNPAVFYRDLASKKNPVDLIPIRMSGKSVMGSRIRLLKRILKTGCFDGRLIIISGENIITWAKGRGIKISHENHGNITGKLRQSIKNQTGALNLNRSVEIQMGVDTNHPSPVGFEHTDGTLSRPEAFSVTARHRRRRAQEKMFMVDTSPAFLIKDDVVLPEGR